MPRQSRLDLAGVPQHVLQRGNDRQPCFFAELDRIRYLDTLRELCLKSGCRVHAYVLMTNHVHLLLTPSAVGAVAWVLQALGRRYVRYINDRYARTGTLWEGRYKACLVEGETNLLHCQRYIELNPVRAAMVESPRQYRWSSFAYNGHGDADPLLQAHASYLALGDDAVTRQARYRSLFEEVLGPEELDRIRRYLQSQYALGSDRFQASIEAVLRRRAGPAPIGRPRRRESAL